MKNSNYHNYEDLPLFLNAELLAKVLGVGVSSAYELMHEKGFPSVRIGKRFIVPRDDLKRWMEEQVAKRGSRGEKSVEIFSFCCPRATFTQNENIQARKSKSLQSKR